MTSNLKRILFALIPAILVVSVFQNCASDDLPQETTKPSKTPVNSFSPSSTDPEVFGTPPLGTKLCQIFLTSGNTWHVPSDWNSSANIIEAIGNGADAGGNVRAGGGGGAYSKSVNVALSAGSTVAYSVAHIGMYWPSGSSLDGHTTHLSAGDSWLCNSTSNCATMQGSAVVVGAAGGTMSVNGPYAQNLGYGTPYIDAVGGTGGAAALGIATGAGAVKYSGGNGGNCLNMDCSYNPNTQPGSGGGAAGPHGDGLPGGSGAGMGGGADAGFGGAGGSVSQSGNSGGEWDATHGAGGGGGGSAAYVGGAAGGNYGGGGGGGGNDNYGNLPAADASGIGGGGLIVITYQGTTCN